MSRWFRFYDDSLNDPKVQRLPGDKFKAWVNLLCIASKNDGVLPSLDDLAFLLRSEPEKVSELLDDFCRNGLLDPIEVKGAPMSYEPHNWCDRQYKSDSSAERTREYRKRHRDGLRDVTGDVTVTVQNRTESDTDTEQKQKDSEANASDVSVDHRKRLFSEGLSKIAALTGKGQDSCRAFLGKCLKEVGDDAIVVLAAIEDAERNQVIDPSAYIVRLLKGRPDVIRSSETRGSIINAADRAIANLEREIAADNQERQGIVLSLPAQRLR